MDDSDPTASIDGLPSDLRDEITSINAIYGEGTLSVHASPTPASDSTTTVVLSAPPAHPLHHTTLLVAFPAAYPHAPARILGPATTDSARGKGGGHAAAEQARRVLAAVGIDGEPAIFALLAELETQASLEEEPPRRDTATEHSPSPDRDRAIHARTHDPRFDLAAWTTAAPLDSHRSVFVGRAIAVSSAADAAAATAALLAQDRHVARATHNIRAWRFRAAAPVAPVANGATSSTRRIEHQESDDDGESRAGAKVLEVLAAMGAWDVLVVVSRWYGGVKLGPERFRLIGQCARDVLILGGWGGAKTDEKKAKKKGK